MSVIYFSIQLLRKIKYYILMHLSNEKIFENIPIGANILAKSDSRERLNLAPHMHHETEMTP